MTTQQNTVSLKEKQIALRNLLNVNTYKFGNYVLDVPTRTLTHDGQATKMIEREMIILILLAANVNKMVEKESLLLALWGNESPYNLRTLDVYISRLRGLFKNDETIYIFCVYAKGFKLIC